MTLALPLCLKRHSRTSHIRHTHPRYYVVHVCGHIDFIVADAACAIWMRQPRLSVPASNSSQIWGSLVPMDLQNTSQRSRARHSTSHDSARPAPIHLLRCGGSIQRMPLSIQEDAVHTRGHRGVARGPLPVVAAVGSPDPLPLPGLYGIGTPPRQS